MIEMTIAVCDSQQEVQFAVTLLERLGYTVAQPDQVQRIQLLEAVSTPSNNAPSNFFMSGRFAKVGQALFVVTGRR